MSQTCYDNYRVLVHETDEILGTILQIPRQTVNMYGQISVTKYHFSWKLSLGIRRKSLSSYAKLNLFASCIATLSWQPRSDACIVRSSSSEKVSDLLQLASQGLKNVWTDFLNKRRLGIKEKQTEAGVFYINHF